MEETNDIIIMTSTKTNSEMLCDAALEGNVELLAQLLVNDSYILHRPSSILASVLPLHLATKFGHVRFALQILQNRPDLISAVDPLDQSSTPLHLASRGGHLNMVRCLVAAKPSICFARDSQGRNPIHVAVEEGHGDVVLELAEAFPAAARERVRCYGVGSSSCRDGDTIMHLCVKQGNLEMLKLIVEEVLTCDDDENDKTMLNAKDGDGNTILHWAVSMKQIKIVEFLLADKRIHKNSRNSDGLTPMDILFFKHQTHANPNGLDQHIKHKLEQAKAFRSTNPRQSTAKSTDFGNWIEKQQSGLMVVASLIATMAFQACVNPPAAFLVSSQQGTSNNDDDVRTKFIVSNTVGFMFSVSSILLLITGLRFNKIRVFVFVIAMWVALTAMIVVYHISSGILTEGRVDMRGFLIFVVVDVLVVGVFGVVFMLAGKWVRHLIAWLLKRVRWCVCCCFSGDGNRERIV